MLISDEFPRCKPIAREELETKLGYTYQFNRETYDTIVQTRVCEKCVEKKYITISARHFTLKRVEIGPQCFKATHPIAQGNIGKHLTRNMHTNFVMVDADARNCITNM